MNQHQEEEHYLPPFAVYVGVWAILLALTVVTVGISYLDLKNVTVLAALIIATAKASLVLLYFMRLRYEKPIFAVMLFAVGVTYAIFVGLTFSDYLYR